MIIHVPDQYPGRCKNLRQAFGVYGEVQTLRCLGYEGRKHTCAFEKPKITTLTTTSSSLTLDNYLTSNPSPWTSPLDTPNPTERQHMNEASPIDRTYMVLLVDRSGSMGSIKSDMEPAMNKFVADQREVPGKCRMTFAQFDDVYEVVHEATKLSDIPRLTLTPRNSTALLDAMGRTLTDARAYVAALPASKHPKYKIIMVVTDGMENASREWSREKVFDLVKKMEAEGWQFTYVGANQDAIQVGSSMGFSRAASMTYDATGQGVAHSFAAMSVNTSSLRSATSDSYAYTGAQRKAASTTAAPVDEDENTVSPS